MQDSILTEAYDLINGERRIDYGSATESFTQIANLWSVILGVEVQATQVALCMIQLKISRFLNGHQRDSLVDIAGYAGCIDLIQQEQQLVS